MHFIAISNGVDSEKRESAEFAPFLNIMNEWYVRDTSRKITTVLRARRMTGNAHTSNHCPYGYKKDTLDSTRWVIDEPAAEVFRRIFRLCIAGKGSYDIARILHDEKVERPSYYMGKRGLGTHCTTYDTENPYMWRGNTVATILSKPEYKRNRKQWKCQTVESTDWNSKENAKMWRKDLADTINAANEQLGIAVRWEHRSFKEQGIDREPTIHIGAVANALERKGIQTERGNINREIIKNNMLLEQAKEMLMLAKHELHSAQYATYKSTQIKNAAISREPCQLAGMEVMEMIAKLRERKGRFDLPIVSGKHLRKISDRTALQSADNAEKFITTRKMDSFESLAKYPELKEHMQSLLQNSEKITPKQWKAEIQSLQSEYDSIGKEQTKTATELAYAEVISYNRKNLERELQNESRQHNRQQSRTKRREEEINENLIEK